MPFSFQGKRMMLTFPTHLNPTTVVEALAKLCPKSSAPKLKILHETGASGYEHTHVVVLLSKRVKLASDKKWTAFRETLGNFDLKPISSDEHFANALGYNKSKKKKKTTENSKIVLDTIGEWVADKPHHIQCIEFIQQVECWKDVLTDHEFSEYISKKMTWAREVYMHARMRKSYAFPLGKAYDWQQTFLDLFQQAPDDRTIHWVYDKRGGNGKSALTNYLLSNHNAFLVDSGKLSDIAYAYDNQPIVVFDLSRDTEDYCPYRAMEGFKNGRFFSPKYMSCLKTFTPPHVVVFTNWRPDFEKLSEDRWDYMVLDDKKLSSNPTIKKAHGVPPSVKAPPEKKRISPTSCAGVAPAVPTAAHTISGPRSPQGEREPLPEIVQPVRASVCHHNRGEKKDAA